MFGGFKITQVAIRLRYSVSCKLPCESNMDGGFFGNCVITDVSPGGIFGACRGCTRDIWDTCFAKYLPALLIYHLHIQVAT